MLEAPSLSPWAWWLYKEMRWAENSFSIVLQMTQTGVGGFKQHNMLANKNSFADPNYFPGAVKNSLFASMLYNLKPPAKFMLHKL